MVGFTPSAFCLDFTLSSLSLIKEGHGLCKKNHEIIKLYKRMPLTFKKVT